VMRAAMEAVSDALENAVEGALHALDSAESEITSLEFEITALEAENESLKAVNAELRQPPPTEEENESDTSDIEPIAFWNSQTSIVEQVQQRQAATI